MPPRPSGGSPQRLDLQGDGPDARTVLIDGPASKVPDLVYRLVSTEHSPVRALQRDLALLLDPRGQVGRVFALDDREQNRVRSYRWVGNHVSSIVAP